MRRIATTLGTLAVAAMLSLSVSQSAPAASGDLIINGRHHYDPSGCYDSNRWPLSVENHTDTVAVVYDSPGCEGGEVGFVESGDGGVFEFGQSVSID